VLLAGGRLSAPDLVVPVVKRIQCEPYQPRLGRSFAILGRI
jgi:hypothetical protein